MPSTKNVLKFRTNMKVISLFLCVFLVACGMSLQAKNTRVLRNEPQELQLLYAQWEGLQGVDVDEKQRAAVAAKILQYWERELEHADKACRNHFHHGLESYQESQKEWFIFRDGIVRLAAHHEAWRNAVSDNGEKARGYAPWQDSDRLSLLALLTMQRVVDLKAMSNWHGSFLEETALSLRPHGEISALEQYCKFKSEHPRGDSLKSNLLRLIFVYEAQQDTAFTLLSKHVSHDKQQELAAIKQAMQRIPELSLQALNADTDIVEVGKIYLDFNLGYKASLVEVQYHIIMAILENKPYSFRVYQNKE